MHILFVVILCTNTICGYFMHSYYLWLFYALILFVIILCTHTICGYLVILIAGHMTSDKSESAKSVH